MNIELTEAEWTKLLGLAKLVDTTTFTLEIRKRFNAERRRLRAERRAKRAQDAARSPDDPFKSDNTQRISLASLLGLTSPSGLFQSPGFIEGLTGYKRPGVDEKK